MIDEILDAILEKSRDKYFQLDGNDDCNLYGCQAPCLIWADTLEEIIEEVRFDYGED